MITGTRRSPAEREQAVTSGNISTIYVVSQCRRERSRVRGGRPEQDTPPPPYDAPPPYHLAVSSLEIV